MDLRLFNVAMLGKWIWRLVSDKDGLWKEVIESKYGGWRSPKEFRSSHMEFLWWKDLNGIWRSGEGILWLVLSGQLITRIIFCFGMMSERELKL